MRWRRAVRRPIAAGLSASARKLRTALSIAVADSAAAAAPDATHDPTAPEHVISNVWPDICKFMVLTEYARVARTCRSLKEAITVDGKIATRRFRCFPEEKDFLEPRDESDPPIKGEPDAPFNFMPQALRVIHFTFLQELTFRISWNGCFARINDFHTATFPLIAEHISEAANLEKLGIHAGFLVKHDVDGQLDFLFDEFAEGLASCQRLHSLEISATKDGIHSLGMIRAITPTIRANRLRFIRVDFRGDAVAHDESAGKDFFRAVIAADKVEHLLLKCADEHFSLLVDSINVSKTSSKSSLLKSLYLHFDGSDSEPIGGLETVLKFFERESLEAINIHIASNVWAGVVGGAGVLHEFLEGCIRNVYALSLYFGDRKVCNEEFCNVMGGIIASSVMRLKKGSFFTVCGCNISFREATARRLEDFLHSNNIKFIFDRDGDFVTLSHAVEVSA